MEVLWQTAEESLSILTKVNGLEILRTCTGKICFVLFISICPFVVRFHYFMRRVLKTNFFASIMSLKVGLWSSNLVNTK